MNILDVATADGDITICEDDLSTVTRADLRRLRDKPQGFAPMFR
jgi:hypothetical protein